jgi:catechol 2,3-dioxygenase-like lactoylglutathione lyase family enzyme
MPSRAVVIDHLTVGVSDLEVSRRFYAQALEALGFSEIGPWSDAKREISFGVAADGHNVEAVCHADPG